MKCLALCAALLAVAAAVPTKELHPFSDEYIAKINEKATTWVAGKNFEINQYEYARSLLGAKDDEDSPADGEHNLITNPHNEDEEVPESFDARERWPQCESIGEIRDQSECGACWAVSSASAMSDRICIHSNFTKQTRVSSTDLMACCTECGGGCDGGIPRKAWLYWQTPGIVTGGLYKGNQGCIDYNFEPCEHHIDGPRPPCKSLHFTTPACTSQCLDSSLNYADSKTYGGELVSLTNEKQIQLEILKNGPIQTRYDVFTDFFSYRSGIYQPTSDHKEYGHAVKVVGWGVEKGVKYWLVANSWYADWGENGYFRIIRGINSCGIEAKAFAALPKF